MLLIPQAYSPIETITGHPGGEGSEQAASEHVQVALDDRYPSNISLMMTTQKSDYTEQLSAHAHLRH